MSVLTVTNVPDEIVAELERLALKHGVSVEDEARVFLSRILQSPEAEELEDKGPKTFKEHLLSMPDVGEDWMFDRNDPRMKRPEKKPLRFED